MAALKISPTGIERTFDKNEIIVSKTDLKGRITYANRVFLRVSQFEEHELLGKAHNIIRHPAMPRCVFQLLWDAIQESREIFAYVINICKAGDHYWVLAHVTPTHNDAGEIIGYHSSRRVPDRTAVAKVKDLYATLCEAERPYHVPHDAIAASMPIVVDLLRSKHMSYDEFVFSL